MSRVLGAAVMALLLCPLPGGAQQSLAVPAAADDTIGRVKHVTGDWFLEGAGERRKLVAGQEFPPQTQLVAGRFAGGGADTRAIELEMFDGSVRSLKCADGATCDGPIPLAIEPSGFMALIRSVLRRLHRPSLTPLIIGKAEPGGVLELKEGQIELGGVVYAYMQKPSSRPWHLRWCTTPTAVCEPLDGVAGRADGTDLKVRPKMAMAGLYALEARAPNRATADASWYVLAVESAQYLEAYQNYATIMQLPVFAQLTDADRRRAQTLLLEAMAATLTTPR
jgi:hypothetical protein